ncbi:MAG: TAT-variant-translocated molybdopterin oxidoreductase, partial [Planctomycetota bacterium]|nr:TAT-variant-translocated molybdopterin oxidoreductase [Planctomycetota bacterium]
MSSVGKPQPPGKKYWRSLDEVADTPEFRQFMHREFPAGASELLDGDDRRHFLKIMGASMALAGMGLTGCRRWPAEDIAPFASRPIDRVPGLPRFFATSMELGGVAYGLLATSYDGRPTKIEGNPDHPVSRGKSDVFAQASVLDLYDPDRSRTPYFNNERSEWDAFSVWAKEHFSGLRSSGGQGLRILTEASDSPSVAVMKQRLLEEYPQAQWHEWEPLHNDNCVGGSQLAFNS